MHVKQLEIKMKQVVHVLTYYIHETQPQTTKIHNRNNIGQHEG